ncbi:MAG: hypothetical protein J6T10_14580 [Methanobrevibacter sp.]|nr:hypothetical protein [Methanobrevibacter sp.]
MGNENKDAINALIDGIQYIVKEMIASAPFDKVKNGKIVSENSDGTYTVSIDNRDYIAKSIHDTTLSVGTVVKVMIPQNDYSSMFILN